MLLPTVNDVLARRARLDLISVGFLLSLWSGSRALNVFVDTISIMYGQNGRSRDRPDPGPVACALLRRLVVGIVVIPLVLIGPDAHRRWLPRPGATSWRRSTGRSSSSSAWRADDAVPRLHARDDAAGGATCPAPSSRWSIWVLASFVVRGTVGRVARRHLDLRPAVGADRPAHLAVRPGHRGPHRCRPQRGDPGPVAGARCGVVTARPAWSELGRAPRWTRRRADHGRRARASVPLLDDREWRAEQRASATSARPSTRSAQARRSA